MIEKRSTKYALCLLSAMNACMYLALKKHSIGDPRLKAGLTRVWEETQKIRDEWPGLTHKTRRWANRRLKEWGGRLDLNQTIPISCLVAVAYQALIHASDIKHLNAWEQQLLSRVAPALEDCSNFFPANFEAYKQADNLLEALYEVIGFKP